MLAERLPHAKASPMALLFCFRTTHSNVSEAKPAIRADSAQNEYATSDVQTRLYILFDLKFMAIVIKMSYPVLVAMRSSDRGYRQFNRISGK